jgi:hypothetical protein
MRWHAVATWTRYLGALALLGVGLDLLEQFSVDSYSVIPTIGTLFALTFASAALLAAGLAAPVRRVPGRAGRLAVLLLSLAAIGVAAGSLVGLLVSESAGLFGFMETGYRPAILIAIGLEATTVALLGDHRPSPLPARPASPTRHTGLGRLRPTLLTTTRNHTVRGTP